MDTDQKTGNAIAVNLELLRRQGWEVTQADTTLDKYTAQADYTDKTLRLNIAVDRLAHEMTNRVISDAYDNREGTVLYGFSLDEAIIELGGLWHD